MAELSAVFVFDHPNWERVMEIKDLEKLVTILEDSAVSEFEYEKDGATVRISRAMATGSASVVAATPVVVQPATAAPVATSDGAAAVVDESLVRVESPIVGTFYRRPNPESDPFVKTGERVSKGETLCIVEAMKLMNEIESPVAGVVEKIFLEDSNVVEYGEVLFLIRPD